MPPEHKQSLPGLFRWGLCFFYLKRQKACYIGKNYANWANHATIEVQTDGEKTMNFTILDLEWNGTYDPKQAKYIN